MYSPVMPSWEASVVELSPSICEISTIQTREGSGKHLKGLKFFQANFGPFLKQTLGEKNSCQSRCERGRCDISERAILPRSFTTMRCWGKMIKRRSTLLSNQLAGQHAGRRIVSVTNKMKRRGGRNNPESLKSFVFGL